MRNLKKILALVLALVMSLSLVTMANAGYSDDAAIDNDEAVAVMSALGVLQGSDGKFDPDSILTREQAAKIITYMLMGKEKADKLTTIIAPFSDVAADRWSAGSIAYCADQGILDGIGGGKFDPTGKLTGLQFAKMILCALGYDAAIEGLTGETFAIKAATLAVELGLDAGIDASLSAQMSRENAAQMALNALQATLVKYEGGTTVELPGGTKVVVGADKEDVYMAGAADYDERTDKDSATSTQFVEKYFADLKKEDAAADKYGRPSSYKWTLKDEDVYTVATAPIATYVNAWDKDAKEALEDKDYTFSATIVYNGGTSANCDEMSELMAAGEKAKNGYTIEMYDANDDDVIEKIIVIEQYFAQVDTFTAAKNNVPASVKVIVKEVSAADKNLIVVDNTKKTDDMYDVIAAGFEKGDYVAVTLKDGWDTDLTKGADVLFAIEDVTAVAGKITKKTTAATPKNTSTKVTIDGVEYSLNNECAGSVPALDIKVNGEGTLYLDAHGVAIGWVGKAAATTTDKAILVTDSYQTLEDGKLTNKVVGTLSNGESITVTASAVIAEDDLYKVYTYEKDEDTGVYTFADDDFDTADDTYAEGETVSTTLTIAAKTKKFGNAIISSDVKYFFVDDETVTVKTGAQDVTSTPAFVVTNKSGDNVVVTAVFVMAAPAGGEATSDDIIYVSAKGDSYTVVENDSNVTYTYYTAYVNGVEVDNFYVAAADADYSGSFYKSVKDEKTGAYKLAGNSISADDSNVKEVDVATGAVSDYAAGIGTVDEVAYDLSAATVVDLTTEKNGLEDGCTVKMLVNEKTNTAIVIYITAAAE